jgi:flagellar hook assembly protein FlgD
MPGVRLSATPRGLRMGLGPRVARVHVGSGRPTISTGYGPATVWTGIGPSRSRRRAEHRPIRNYQSTAQNADPASRIQALAALEASLVSAHQHDFATAEPGVAPPPEAVDERAIRRQARAEAVSGLSPFAFGARAEAKKNAEPVATGRIREAVAASEQAHAADQRRLDEQWELLQANHPPAVLQALEDAFSDNEVAAVPIDCQGDMVSVVMLYPGADVILEQKPAVTPTGRPTIRKRPKTERNTLYAQSMASHILATAREAFAAAPAINGVTVLTVAQSEAVGGIATMSAVAATGFTRETVGKFNWERLDPWATIEAANPSLVNRRGRTGELAPLDLSQEPGIATVLVTCAELLGVEVDPSVRIPAGVTPHLPDTTADAEASPAPPPTERVAEPAAHPSPTEGGAWARFRGARWWVQALAWLVGSPILASWWCWRRPWATGWRLAAIAAIAIFTLIAATSFNSSNASKNATAPHSPPPPPTSTEPSSAASAPATTTPPKPKPRVQADVAADTFNPIEQDGYHDTVRVYFRTPTASIDTVRVVTRRGRVIRSVQLGRLSAHQTHSWSWDGRTAQGSVAPPGMYAVRVIARHARQAMAAPPAFVRLSPLTPKVGDVGISPSPFYPIEQDGDLDTTTVSFVTNTDAHDVVRVRGPHGRVIRTVDLGTLSAHTPHTWLWDGRNAAGVTGGPGAYAIQITAAYYGSHAHSQWRPVKIKKQHTTASSRANCTPGYSPCIPYRSGADYDCGGGSGNGPYYADNGPYTVTPGEDIYGLDGDGDGVACEY